MQRIVHLFGPERLGEVMSSPNPIILPLINYHMSLDVHIFILFFKKKKKKKRNMSIQDVVGPIIPSARQTIYISVCTKLRFQRTLRNLFGQERLAAINE